MTIHAVTNGYIINIKQGSNNRQYVFNTRDDLVNWLTDNIDTEAEPEQAAYDKEYLRMLEFKKQLEKYDNNEYNKYVDKNQYQITYGDNTSGNNEWLNTPSSTSNYSSGVTDETTSAKLINDLLSKI